MANNQFLDATEYSKTMLLLLKNNLTIARLVTGEFKNEVTDENGLTVNIKRPPMFVAQDGEALALQRIIIGSTPVVVDKYKNVHIDVGDLENIQSFNQLMKNSLMESAASELAHVIDGAIHDILPEFANSVGTPGTTIASPQQFNKVHTRLMSQAVPNNNLNAVVSYDDGELIRGNLIGTNIQGTNKIALERVRIPILSDVNLFATNNIRTITAGTRSATALIDGANQHVNYVDIKDTNTQTIALDALGTTKTIKRGDTFTIAGVFAVNPRSRQVLPYLKQFVVLVDATSDAVTTGDATLTISPPIIVPGTSDGTDTIVNTAFQTVGSIPADGAVVTWTTAPGAISEIRAAFHKQAISLVSARLITPMSDTSSFISDPQTGIGIRYWRGSDILTGRHIHRWDVVFGVQAIQRALGSRVNGS